MGNGGPGGPDASSTGGGENDRCQCFGAPGLAPGPSTVSRRVSCRGPGSPWGQIPWPSKGVGWEEAPQPPFGLGCRECRGRLGLTVFFRFPAPSFLPFFLPATSSSFRPPPQQRQALLRHPGPGLLEQAVPGNSPGHRCVQPHGIRVQLPAGDSRAVPARR